MSKIVTLGSIGIDHVYSVEHFTTAGETMVGRTHDIFPGGKGLNQSIAAAKAGAEVVHVGSIGDDGKSSLNALRIADVDVEDVRVGEDATGHAMIQVDDAGQNAIVVYGGANRALTENDREAAFNRLEEGDWLLLQNEINGIDEVLQRASEQNALVAFNVAPVDGSERDYDYRNVDLLIVNEVEAALLAGIENPGDAFDHLVATYPKMVVVLTLGREGGICGGNGHPKIAYEAHDVQAVDETAAGDSFIGFFMAEWVRSQDLAAALADGSAAGALAVTKHGAASSIPTREEVAAFKSQSSN
ncbi:MAG: ribokinase [Gammaproteobacteria bacterium]|nr:ribokinase [Gammaproteobacteria bacterium]